VVILLLAIVGYSIGGFNGYSISGFNGYSIGGY